MKINDEGLDILKQFESLALKAYPDPGSADGHPYTIGYGHTGNVHMGDVINEDQADLFLRDDVAKFEQGVSDMVKVSLTDNQFSALVVFAFNVGLGSLHSSTLLKLLNASDFDGAAAQFLRWNKNNGVVMNGLTRRRQAEKDLFES